MVEKNTLGLFLAGFIAILIGVNLVAIVGDTVYSAVTLTNQNETGLTRASGIFTLGDDDISGFSFFGNSTNNTDSSGGTIGVDVNFTRAGVVTAGTDIYPSAGTYYAVYTFEPDAYVVDLTSRVFINLITLFFALAILAVSIGVPMVILKKEGLM